MKRVKVFVAATAIALVAFLAQGCAGKDVNTVVADTADYGAVLAKAIGATAKAVADAEAARPELRNQANAAMDYLQKANDASKVASAKLRQILEVAKLANGKVDGSLIDEAQVALDLISSNLFSALIPIKDDALRLQISGLAAEASKTISVIQREVLGRLKQ